MIFWRQVWAVAWKDLVLERRTRQSLTTMLVFSIVSVVTFNFALDADLSAARSVSLGLLWVVIWLAGTLGLNRSFSAETESRALDAILISPIPRNAIFFGKLFSLLLTLLVTEIILIPLFVILFNKPFYRPALLLVLFLGTVGYVAAGVFVGSMAAQTRSSYFLIPVMLLPLTLPVVLAASAVSAETLQVNPDYSLVATPLILILIYDVIMLGFGYLFYTYVVEE